MPLAPTLLLHRRFKAIGAAALLAVCVFTALPARAEGDLEREQLSRIAAELRQVESMADQASQAAQGQPGAPVRFRYDWLKRDLQMIRQGIEQHVDAPRQPRPVPPLRGDYRS